MSDSSPKQDGANAVDALDFEAAMRELETIVSKMERGDIPLEDALKQFERGIALTRRCQQALSAAEQKVKILSAGSDADAELDSFENDAELDED